MKKYKFKNTIEEIFGKYLWEYKENKKQKEIFFELDEIELNKEKLLKLIDFLGEKTIEIDSIDGAAGCCSYSYEPSCIRFTIKNINFD